MLTSSIHSSVEPNYSHKDVVKQLKLILAHELFNNAPVLSNFLKFIVEETLAGKLKSLKEYTIGVSGLGKKVDFNPQIDASVRIHAGRLRRLLSDYYSGPGVQDNIIIEVVKGSYVPVFRRRLVGPEMPKIISLSLEEMKHATISKVTVAVLPFRNLSPGSDIQFLADSLGEELTYVFSTSDEFSVIGHLSTLKLSEQHVSLHDIGEQLNARYILTGTVMRSRTLIRVHVGVVEAPSNTQIWSKVFDYASDVEPIKILDDTVKEVHNTVCGQFGLIIRHAAGSSKKFVEESVDFDAALWHYNFQINFSFFNYAKTRRALELVRQHDAQFPSVFAMLSELYLWGHILGYPTADHPVAAGLQLAHKAVSLDPNSNHACSSFFWASLLGQAAPPTLEEVDQFMKAHPALACEPGKAGMALVCCGHYERGRTLLEQSMHAQPVYPWSFDLALALLHLKDKQYADALARVDRIDATDIYFVDLMKTILLCKLGMPREAKPFHDALVENFPFIMLNLKSYLEIFLRDRGLSDLLVAEAQQAGIAIAPV